MEINLICGSNKIKSKQLLVRHIKFIYDNDQCHVQKVIFIFHTAQYLQFKLKNPNHNRKCIRILSQDCNCFTRVFNEHSDKSCHSETLPSCIIDHTKLNFRPNITTNHISTGKEKRPPYVFVLKDAKLKTI